MLQDVSQMEADGWSHATVELPVHYEAESQNEGQSLAEFNNNVV